MRAARWVARKAVDYTAVDYTAVDYTAWSGMHASHTTRAPHIQHAP